MNGRSEVVVVWRASGADFDVDHFLEQFPSLSPDAVWRKGERDRRDAVNDRSGFNQVMVEQAATRDASDFILRSLSFLSDPMVAARSLGARSQVDVGLMVGVDDFVVGLIFSEEVTRRLGAIGVELVVTVYPTSEDDEDEDEGEDSEAEEERH